MRIKMTRIRKKVLKNDRNVERVLHESFQDTSLDLVKVEQDSDTQKTDLASLNAELNIVSCDRIKNEVDEITESDSIVCNIPVKNDESDSVEATASEQINSFVCNINQEIKPVLEYKSICSIQHTDLSRLSDPKECNNFTESSVNLDSPSMQFGNIKEEAPTIVNQVDDSTGVFSISSKEISTIIAEEKTTSNPGRSTQLVSQTSEIKRRHRKTKFFFCNQCNYKCSRSNHLKVHERIHTGEKPYSCDKCTYKSTQLGHLKIHKRTHTGEKPFYCDQCDYKSSQLGHLKQHKTNHTGEKPFSCDMCTYKCTQLSDLKVHKRIHTGVNQRFHTVYVQSYETN